MSKLQLRLIDDVERAERDRRATIAKVKKMVRRNGKMFATLEALGDCTVKVDALYGCVDVQVIGDAQPLTRVWKVLRLNGFAPDERPESKQSYFSTFFRKEGDAVFLSFTSTVCKRVQVGTKTQEVPVYETVCDNAELAEVALS